MDGRFQMAGWDTPEIAEDARINRDDPRVRVAAELLHRGESIYHHRDITAQVCVYCALRASRIVRFLDDLKSWEAEEGDES